jgi:hypothetical protein
MVDERGSVRGMMPSENYLGAGFEGPRERSGSHRTSKGAMAMALQRRNSWFSAQSSQCRLLDNDIEVYQHVPVAAGSVTCNQINAWYTH